MAEDRELFRKAMTEIGLEVPASAIAHSMEEALEKDTESEVSSSSTMSRALPWVVAAAMAVISGTVVLWSNVPSTSGVTSLMKLELPMAVPLSLDGVGASSLAVSPDGTTLAYVVSEGGRRQIVLRSTDEAEGHPMPATENGQAPFFSPDGQWLGFFADGKLKKVPIDGGPPLILCDAPIPMGGTWSRDDVIIFAPLDNSGLSQVSAAGGEPRAFTSPENREHSHGLPHFLPSGDAILFTVLMGHRAQQFNTAHKSNKGRNLIMCQCCLASISGTCQFNLS